MDAYSVDVERKMKRFFDWLSEKDRRRYAAVEAAKLGHGGVEYVARVLQCDPKTIRQGLQDLEEPEMRHQSDQKKGRTPTADQSRPQLKPTCDNCCGILAGDPMRVGVM